MCRIIYLTLPPDAPSVTMEPKHTGSRGTVETPRRGTFSHPGTHLDAPVHFAVSPRSIDEQTVSVAWVAQIVPCAPRTLLTVAHLAAIAEKFAPHRLEPPCWKYGALYVR